MKVTTPEISWHEREPIFSIDFQLGTHAIQRLASCGGDKVVRVWQMTFDSDGRGNFEFLSNLNRHTASVNAVRFSKNGEYLASAGDDLTVLVWKLSDVASPSNNIFSEEDVEKDKETWTCFKTLRGHLGDVLDLSWSKDSRYLVSGSVDNSAIVWDVKTAQKIAFFNDHKSYVQGVAFDPLGDFIATMSSDRSLRIFSLSSKNCVHNISKMVPPTFPTDASNEAKPKAARIFHDDGLRSFFRRLEFSSDGHLVFAPAGCVESGGDKLVNASFVFVRGAFSKPALYLPSGDKPTIVVRANPQLFELRLPKDFDPDSIPEGTPEWESRKSLISLPYRVIFAAATDDSVLIYDSQQAMPVALMKNIHYHQISDLSWSPDGQALIVSSTDGFCTICTFDEGELGIAYCGGSRRRRAAASDTKPQTSTGDQEIISTNQKSPPKTTSSELPFTRYTEKHEEMSEKKKEINTALNIRKVKTPKDNTETINNQEREKDIGKVNTMLNIRKVTKEEGNSTSLKDRKATSSKQVMNKNDSETKSAKEEGGEKKDSDKFNTSLNIRKVGKEDKDPPESKKVQTKENTPNKDCSETDRNKVKKDSPKINSFLNIRKVKKEEKKSDFGEEKFELTNNTISILPGDVKKLDIEDSKDKEGSSIDVRKADIIEDVEMLEDVQKDEKAESAGKLNRDVFENSSVSVDKKIEDVIMVEDSS